MYTVYCHFNKINGKLYFGLTKYTIKKRKQNGYFTCNKLRNAINKYGWDSFDSFVIRDNLTKEDACSLEKELIKRYHTTEQNRGYNIHLGGTAPEVTDEFRKKMRAITLKIRKEHPEISKNNSKKMKEYYKTHEPTRGMLGKHHSEETKRKIGESNKNKGLFKIGHNPWNKDCKISYEHREKLKKTMFKKGHKPWNKGIYMTKERYEKCKDTMFKKGQSPWCKGKKMTEEQKQKLRNAKRKSLKKVLCLETGVIYDKIIDVERTLGIASQTIVAVCKGRPHFKTAGGYHWKYI